MTAAPPTRQSLRYTAAMSASTSPRGLGFWMCLALVIGNMIGSGVFLLPASLAPYGVNSILGWLVTAAGSVLLAIVFARLARSYPDAAGPYVYPRKAFGEATGFLTAWGYWMAVWIGNAAIVTGTVAYLAELVPAIKQTVAGPAIVRSEEHTSELQSQRSISYAVFCLASANGRS